jgi:hypothetical protein
LSSPDDNVFAEFPLRSNPTYYSKAYQTPWQSAGRAAKIISGIAETGTILAAYLFLL